jgi:hypothetical protein
VITQSGLSTNQQLTNESTLAASLGVKEIELSFSGLIVSVYCSFGTQGTIGDSTCCMSLLWAVPNEKKSNSRVIPDILYGSGSSDDNYLKCRKYNIHVLVTLWVISLQSSQLRWFLSVGTLLV